MSLAGSFGCFLLVAAQDREPSADVLLAKIPEGVAIAGDYELLTNRGRVRKRSTLNFSSDGSRVAYAGRRGDEWIPVVGSKLGDAYDYVSAPALAGGKAIFKVGRSLGASKEHAWVWVDGKLIGPEDWMGELAVSADGRRIAYWTQPGALVGNGPTPVKSTCFFAVASETSAGKWSVSRGAEWKEHASSAPLFSDDGERVFTCAVGPKGWVHLSRARKEIALGEPCAMIDSIAVSRDGGVQALLTTLVADNKSRPEPTARDQPELYFQEKRIGRNFAAIARPIVDQSGKHVAFIVASEHSQSVAVDDEKNQRGAYDHVLELCFDPTGRRVAFVANMGGVWSKELPGLLEGGESFLVVRDISGDAAFREEPHHALVEDLVWDPAGELVAYRAKDEQDWRIVCGAQKSEPHDLVCVPQFAGAKIRFGSRDKSELWWREMPRP